MHEAKDAKEKRMVQPFDTGDVWVEFGDRGQEGGSILKG